MEYGPRALGNRTVMAPCHDPSINQWLNKKFARTEFMPFAPSVLAEYADDVFENVDKARHTAEFMTITFDVRPAWRERIPAVVHVDGTARVQTVTCEQNPALCALLQATIGLQAYHIWSAILIGHVTRCALSVVRFRQEKWRHIHVAVARS